MKACERYLNAINELVDGTLGPLRRTELELHLEGCEGCRALAAELQPIRDTARSLDTMPAPPRAWAAIEARLRAEGRVAARPLGIGARPYAALALAAALVLALGASLFVVTSRNPAPAPVTTVGDGNGNAESVHPVQSVESEMALTEKHFQNVVERADQVLDPATAAVLQKNLLVMNQALEESRKVLEADPQNLPARQSFYETLRQKIEFLQTTIALMNQMRQGDAAGAAEIVEGGKS
ncbi:hypothetical protein BH24ACI4_BH24ACI4_24470 [soil metagenome]